MKSGDRTVVIKINVEGEELSLLDEMIQCLSNDLQILTIEIDFCSQPELVQFFTITIIATLI